MSQMEITVKKIDNGFIAIYGYTKADALGDVDKAYGTIYGVTAPEAFSKAYQLLDGIGATDLREVRRVD